MLFELSYSTNNPHCYDNIVTMISLPLDAFIIIIHWALKYGSPNLVRSPLERLFCLKVPLFAL